MIHGFNANDPTSIFTLAMQIIELNERDHRFAVELCKSIRESTIGLVVATALVTQVQDPENPIVAISEDDADSGDCQYNPAELLQSLAEGFPTIEDIWEEAVSKFKGMVEKKRSEKVEKEIADMPAEVFVSDILGEDKNA